MVFSSPGSIGFSLPGNPLLLLNKTFGLKLPRCDLFPPPCKKFASQNSGPRVPALCLLHKKIFLFLGRAWTLVLSSCALYPDHLGGTTFALGFVFPIVVGMGLDDVGDFFRSGQRSGGSAEKKTTMISMAACRAEDPPTSVASNVFSANIAEQVLMGDWNLFVSMAQHMDFGGFTAPSSSGACVQANEWIDAPGGSLTEQVTSLPGFDDGDISQLMSSAALSANGQIAGPLCAADLNVSGEHGDAKDSKGKKRRKMPEHDAFGSQSPISRIQTAEAEQKKEVISGSAKSPIEEDVKKEKEEQKPRASTHKLASKQAKESSSSKGDADKEDYIHLRAKRGHATNSHSLAERVRRQKISERMKFLQDLVPGCSKITGKAVMLDEIINYIQSLQHQVEFLSMKLATVNPEVNLDVEKIVSKEAFYSQTGGSDALGFYPGFISSPPPSRMSAEQGAMQVEMAIPNNPNSREELKNLKHMARWPSECHTSKLLSQWTS